jgi:membrane-bound lytic murein transglycosylase D
MKQDPSKEMTNLMGSVDIDEKEYSKTQRGEYLHELAEANANDNDIKKEVGANELDEELPDSESDTVPFSREFLANKKTKRMQFWVDYFTKKERDRFQRFINNGEEYRHHIEQILVEQGLPKELYFVGLIESGYYLGARSHAAAVGPWQFIRGTGKRYGLTINHQIDERQDLFKATRAAAAYFRDLHNVFSSWELALSAYNAGEYGIIRRIMKHGTRDFYQLSKNKQLPSETINYVPKVLAAMHVVNNAKKYGFNLPQKKQRLFDLTQLQPVKKNISLHSIASRLNISVDLLRKLNPELRTSKTPGNYFGTYYIRVPQNSYVASLESMIPEVATSAPTNLRKFTRPESRKDVAKRTASARNKFHKVEKGETLFSIARKYSISAKEIAQYNNFKTWKVKLKSGQRISLTKPETELKVKITNKPLIYKVIKGDNLNEIARLFNTGVAKIKKVNNLNKNQVHVGQKIILPGTQKAIYTVRVGDHLTKVAKEFNLPAEALIKLNSLKQKKIYPGQKIMVNID